MKRQMTGLLLAVFLAAGPALAQDHQHPPDQGQADSMMGMMMQMMQMGDGMMGMMAGSPGMILRLRDALGLTDEQVRRLEEIQERTHHEHQQQMQASRQMMTEAAAILEGDAPDLARYEGLLHQAAEYHVQAHLSMARGVVEAREVLTPEQRSNVRFGTRMMQQMGAGHMPGMMGTGAPAPPDGPRH